MKEIVVTVKKNKIVGTTSEGHVSFTILPASWSKTMKEMVEDSEKDLAKTIAGIILSGIVYDDERFFEQAEMLTERVQSNLWVKAENYMVQCLDLDYDLFSDCGEINCTKLAEEAAKSVDHDEWLDDSAHWIWDLAFDVAERYEQPEETAMGD